MFLSLRVGHVPQTNLPASSWSRCGTRSLCIKPRCRIKTRVDGGPRSPAQNGKIHLRYVRQCTDCHLFAPCKLPHLSRLRVVRVLIFPLCLMGKLARRSSFVFLTIICLKGGSYSSLSPNAKTKNPPLVHLLSTMASELKTIHKKRVSSEATSTPAPEGDHRKRRRNRTTQSCLNCHTSKRMCDRKRPCGRCTQLGLTGLCVYEVDDPSQRSDAQDESSRLRKRVAELEGVIRELKNKPHPRWTKSASGASEESDKLHARGQSCTPSEDSPKESCNLSDTSRQNDDSRSDSSEGLFGRQLTHTHFQLPGHISPFPQLSLDCSSSAPLATYSSYFGMLSPLSTPSSAVMTPTDGHSQIPVMIAGEQGLPHDVDLASIFTSCPELGGRDDGMGHIERTLRSSGILDKRDNACFTKPNLGQFVEGHCGCLNEAASYNVVLELSLRLRKAADVLRRSSSHQFHNGCMLNQKIMDLDSLATTTLGNMTASPNDLDPFHPCCLTSVNNAGSSMAIPSSFPSNGHPAVATVSPQSLQGLRSWDVISPVSNSPSTCDDSFMSWEPPRRG